MTKNDEESIFEEMKLWFDDEHLNPNQNVTINEKAKSISLQHWGFEVVLLPNGTYYVNDTSG